MAVYFYKAKKGPKEFVQGQIEAQNRQEVCGKLDSLGLFPMLVKEKAVSLRRRFKVQLKELMEFTHHLSTLLNSGSTLLASLTTLVSETEQISLRPIISNIILEVKEGGQFSKILEKYPRVFPKVYVSLVKTGEASGTLAQNLKRVAEFLEEELDFRTNLISILTYPLLIAGVGILTVFALFKFIIPRLVSVFDEIGQELPFLTSALKNTSEFISKYWIFIFGVLFLFFLAAKKYFKNPGNKIKWDKTKLDIPLIGDLLKKIEISRFSRTLSILLKNGVAMDESFKIIAYTVSNTFLQAQVSKIEGEIKEGFSLNEAMKRTNVFPNTFINVVTVGEGSGALESVLENYANNSNKAIGRQVKNLLSVLEPVLILGVGLIVGLVVFSMLLPIFEVDFSF